MLKMQIFALVGSFVGLVLSVQSHEAGKCPQRPIAKNFDVSKYLGKWYEIYRYEQEFSAGCTCNYVHYSLKEDGTVLVKNSCQRGGGPFFIEGSAVVSYPTQEPLEARLNVTFYQEPPKSNYWVMDTDYENFAIVYFCDEDENAKEFFWLLSRSKTWYPESNTQVEATIDHFFDRQNPNYTNQDRTECKYDEVE